MVRPTYYLPLRIGVISSDLARNLVNLESKHSSCAPHPTAPLTGLLGSFTRFLLNMVMYSVEQGALTQLWAGTSAETANLNGEVSASSLSVACGAHAIHRSTSSRGRGSENLVVTTQSSGGSFGLGSKNRLRRSDHQHDSGVFYTRLSLNCTRLLISAPTNEVDKGNGRPESGTTVLD